MSRILLPLFGSFFLLLTTTGSMQEPRNRLDIEVEHGIVFGKGGDKDLKLDIAWPRDDKGLYPIVVCIHGGGWISGEREQLAQTIDTLARKGFVAVSPDYRLAPQNPFPAPLEDCKAAIRWLRVNGKKYNGNTDKIGALGFSAGGHLACLLGVTVRADGLDGSGGNPDESSRVQAVVSFFGPTDLGGDDLGPIALKTNIEPLMGGTKAEKPELYKKASPLSYSLKECRPFCFFTAPRIK